MNRARVLELLGRPLDLWGPSHRRELFRLRRLPRYLPTETRLVAPLRLSIPDAASFLFMYREIFEKEIYRFAARHGAPRILDVGANVGLSLIYFKRLYPDARITAFEADPAVFSYLKRNSEAASLGDVTLIDRAAWVSDGQLPFFPEGADAGSITQPASSTRSVLVPSVRLRDYLQETVDFLKMDIEGAEVDVLHDCGDSLYMVDKLFVEYHSFRSQPQRLHELLAVLHRAEFRVWLDSPVPVSQPFTRRLDDAAMDAQVNIFASRGR